jgi:hypothetical protein
MIPKILLAGHTVNEVLSRMSRAEARCALEGYDLLWLHTQFGYGPEAEALILISEAAALGLEIIITIGRGPAAGIWRNLRQEYATFKDLPLSVEIDDLPALRKLVLGRLMGGSK